MRIVSISDLHGHLPHIPECDCLLISGDLPPLNLVRTTYVPDWINSTFYDWLTEIKSRGIEIFAVAGNHDFVFQDNFEKIRKDLPWNYLEDSGCQFKGYNIWGTPWQPYFHNWAFNLYEKDLVKKWELIPKNTDILLCHGPPYGFGDRIGKKHVGSFSLRIKVDTLPNLKLMTCGHIHHGRGIYKLRNKLTIISSSLVNNHYQLVHNPIVFDLED